MARNFSSQSLLPKAQLEDTDGENRISSTKQHLDDAIVDLRHQIEQISLDTKLTIQWIEKTNTEQQEIYQSIFKTTVLLDEQIQPASEETVPFHYAGRSSNYLLDTFSQKSNQLEQLASAAKEVRKKAEDCLMHYQNEDS